MPDFLALCVTTIPTVILVTFLGWWRFIGYNRPAEWRDLWLLLLPAVAIFLPLVAGIKAIDAGTLLFLLVGYLLTGFYEETLFRGVILRILQPKGVWPAVLIEILRRRKSRTDADMSSERAVKSNATTIPDVSSQG